MGRDVWELAEGGREEAVCRGNKMFGGSTVGVWYGRGTQRRPVWLRQRGQEIKPEKWRDARPQKALEAGPMVSQSAPIWPRCH